MQGSSCTAGSSLGLSRAVLANLLSKPAGRSIAGQHGFTSLPLNLRGSLVAQSLKLRPSLYQDLVSADALRQSGLGLTSPFYEPQRFEFTSSPVVCEAYGDRENSRIAPQVVEDAPVVRLRGLPWDTTSQDVEKFLEGVNIGPEGVILTLDQRGRPSGEALVECATLDDADLAMGKNNAYLGTRWIEVFPAGYQDLEFAKKNQNLSATKPELTEEDLSAFGNPDPAYKGVVRMRGLPFRATEEDVVDFFEGYTIVPDGVFLCRLADGRLSGDAFVEFADEEIARKSLELNREQMGRRYVELFPTNKGDMVAAIKIHAQRVMAARRETASSTFVKLRGLPFDVEDYDIQQFFEGYDVVPGSIKIQESFPGRKTGEAFVEFVSPEEADRAMQENNKEIGVRYIELFRVRQEEAQGGGDNRKKNRESGSGSSVASDPASTVRMRGMPFRATVADIVMFFEGFDVVKDSITLGTSPDGRPSGEAWVAFASPEEATRAIRQMNREYMGNRFVELFPA